MKSGSRMAASRTGPRPVLDLAAVSAPAMGRGSDLDGVQASDLDPAEASAEASIGQVAR